MASSSGFRFTVGNDVLCRTGEFEWSRGHIVALNYRERHWPPGKTVPYQVRLAKGTLIFVPADVPHLCKKYIPPSWVLAVDYEDVTKLESMMTKDVENEDDIGQTALLACIGKGWHQGALSLLSKRADPNKSAGPERCTALHLAVQPLKAVEFKDTDKDTISFTRKDDAISAKLSKFSSPRDVTNDESLTLIAYDDLSRTLSWVSDPEEGESWSIVPVPMRERVPARLASLVKGTAVRTDGLPNDVSSTMPLLVALLQARADVNAQNEDPENDLDNFTSTTFKEIEQRAHRSALHYAVEAGDHEACSQLLSAHADPDLKDRYKMTPLDVAIEGGSALIVNLLLQNRASPNQGNMRRGLQQTCLHQVADIGRADLAKLILDHRGNANLAGKQGLTPLHLAARKKHVEVVEALLNSGADVTLLDKLRRTAGQYALTNGSDALGKALEPDLQLCDRIQLLQNAKAEHNQRQQEVEERSRLIELLETT